MTVPIAAPARSARALGLACVVLAGSAGLLGGSAALTWYTVSPPGRAPVVLTGAQVSPSLSGFAWVALAGVAGIVATGGLARRALAGLLALAGAAVAAVGLTGGTRTSYAVGGAPPAPLALTPAPLLAVAAGALLLAVGILVLVREPRLSRLGARYAAPGARPVEVDPDRAAWQDLDAGRDPTADPARDEGDDPGDGAGRGAG